MSERLPVGAFVRIRAVDAYRPRGRVQNFPGASGATRNFADGEYGGAFYGPRELGELEAAGHWVLPVATEHPRPYDGPRAGVGMIIGSFGTRSEEPGN